jgi:hypothetical protein
MMAQIGMDHEHHTNHENGFGGNEWVDMNHSYNSSQHQSPIFEHGGFTFMQPLQHNGLPADSSYNPQRMPQPPPHTTHQQLLPLIMPSHPTWPSMLTNPASYPAPPVAIPPVSAPLVKGMGSTKLPALHHATPSPRKTLTDSDRRRMCQYHEDNPTVKQTEIGGKNSGSVCGSPWLTLS